MGAKRQRSWENEYERQSKILISDKRFNSNNEKYMALVYEKTQTKLFEGAKKLSSRPATPTPCSSQQFSEYRAIGSCSSSDTSHLTDPLSVDSDRKKLDDGSHELIFDMEDMEICKINRDEKGHNKIFTQEDKLEFSRERKKYRQLRLDSLWMTMDKLTFTCGDATLESINVHNDEVSDEVSTMSQ